MATRLVEPLYQAMDANGDPGNGWKLYFYETGTTNPKDTYSDEALTVANANPVICNSEGRPANGTGDPVDIFGANKEDYKVILLDESDNVIETKDPVDLVTYDINSFGTRPAQHWGTTTGTADAFLIKPVPSITAYDANLLFTIQMNLDNNAGSSLAVFEEGTVSTYLAALDMMKYDNAGAKIALEAGDNQANQTYLYRIDGTDAVCLNPGIPYLDPKNINQSTTALRGVAYLNDRITIANNGVDANNDIDFSAGVFDFDDGSGQAVASALTKKLDAVWAIGTDAGGLDTGSKAIDTWYHCYSIYNPTTGVSDALFSLSATAPTMPSGYTKKDRKGSILTDGSGNILAFTQTDKFFEFTTLILNRDTAHADALFAISTPLGVSVEAFVFATSGTGATPSNASVGCGSYYTGSASIGIVISTGTATSNNDNNTGRFITNTSSQIYVLIIIGAGAAGALSTRGWIDYSLK